MGTVIERFIGCVHGAIEKTHQRNLRAVPNEATPVTAVIRLKENVDAASFEVPEGTEVLYRFKYINAVSVRMPGTLATKLSVDSNIAYISQDKYMYPMTETVPWGIPAIQADDPSVPLPDASQPCFKVCIVDSGFPLGHVDLVCTKPLSAVARPLCLDLTSAFSRGSRIRPRRGTLPGPSLESLRVSIGTVPLTGTALM
jgi:hypothetical protein